MKLSNSVHTLLLWTALVLLNQNVVEAKSKVNTKIHSIIRQEIKNADTIDLALVEHVRVKDLKIEEWEPISILYPVKSNEWEENGGIFLHWIDYNSKELSNYQLVIYPSKQWWFIKILIAPKWEEIPPTDFFTVVKIKNNI